MQCCGHMTGALNKLLEYENCRGAFMLCLMRSIAWDLYYLSYENHYIYGAVVVLFICRMKITIWGLYLFVV